MKKLFCLVLTLLCMVMIAACDQDTLSASVEANKSPTTVTQNHNTETNAPTLFEDKNAWPSEEKAEECLLGFVNAQSVEEAAAFANADSADAVRNAWASFAGNTYQAELSFAGEFEGLHVFRCRLIPAGSDQAHATAFAIMRQQEDHYMLCLQQSVQDRLVAQCLCPTCNGNGQIYTGGNICGICGGTGQQYYPNVYYDAVLQMWQGQYQACSGCGGAGRFGGTYIPCGTCLGFGLVFG